MNDSAFGRHPPWAEQTSHAVADGTRYDRYPVVWAGGSQAKDLANVLSGDAAVRAGSNLPASCIDAKAALLVGSKRVSVDHPNTATVHGFSRARTRSIVAAIGGGPHSVLAATVADWLSLKLGLSASAVYGYSDPSDLPEAERVLRTTLARLPSMDACAIEAPSPAAMVGALPDGALLVIGAPEGSWFQRRFFGPGARIRATSSSGNIVVRHSPTRVYQVMQKPVAYGPGMRVSDALTLSEGWGVVVAEQGRLLGTVSASTMSSVRPDLELQGVIEDGIFFSPDDTVDEALALMPSLEGTVVPVVDTNGLVIGCVSRADLTRTVLA